MRRSIPLHLFLLAAPMVAQDYRIRPVPVAAVQVKDVFWAPRLEINRTVTIPHIYKQNEATGRVANFAKAAGRMQGAYQGRRFNDTDIYKWIEAASFSLITHPDPVLDKQVDDLIELIAAAQEKDGYLFPARTADPKKPALGIGPERWVHLNGSHELYNFGHLYEAAVAHFMATGKRTLLDIAIRNAELVSSVFGPNRRRAVPGHEEIELALVKLYRATDKRGYLDLAKFFLDQRGKEHQTEPYPPGPFAMYNDRAYKQDHLPAIEQTKATGHAVRAVYLYSAMADIVALFNDNAYRQASEKLWQDVISKRMYLTGGIGSRPGVEAFGDDYELPNARAYTETCASIGNVLWNHRMFLLTGHAKYLDVAEQVLYNGFLSGVSGSGDRFFYQNPLESEGNRERSAYFDVACCPANVARLIAQVPGLIYSQGDDGVYVNLFVGSETKLKLGGRPLSIGQETRYPWDGNVRITVKTEKPVEFTLRVRIPGWARNQLLASDLYRFSSPVEQQASLTINGRKSKLDVTEGFAVIRRKWSANDNVELRLLMPVRRVLAHDGIVENRGKAALQRGPVVYSLEAVDNGGPVKDLVVPLDSELRSEFQPALLGGVEVLTGKAAKSGPDGPQPHELLAVPYFAWANRGKGQMVVWIRHQAAQ